MSKSPFFKGSASSPLDSFATPPGAGKGPGGGVTLSNNGVEIVVINVETEIGGIGMCGGRIGKGNKRMCIKEDCKVASHMENKVPITDLCSGDWVFVRSGKEAVFVEPSIASQLLQPNLERLLKDKREVEEWATLFKYYENLESQGNPDQLREETKAFEKRLGKESENHFGKTPFKRRVMMDQRVGSMTLFGHPGSPFRPPNPSSTSSCRATGSRTTTWVTFSLTSPCTRACSPTAELTFRNSSRTNLEKK